MPTTVLDPEILNPFILFQCRLVSYVVIAVAKKTGFLPWIPKNPKLCLLYIIVVQKRVVYQVPVDASLVGLLPVGLLPIATFAGRDICRSRHLPVANPNAVAAPEAHNAVLHGKAVIDHDGLETFWPETITKVQIRQVLDGNT